MVNEENFYILKMIKKMYWALWAGCIEYTDYIFVEG